MQHYVLDTYHGPLIVSQRQADWIIRSPFRPPEIFDGTIPPSCLSNARPASDEEVMRLLGAYAAPLLQPSQLPRLKEQVTALVS